MRTIRCGCSLLLAISILTGCAETDQACSKVHIESLRLCLPEGWDRVSQEEQRQRQVGEEVLASYRKASAGDQLVLVVVREPLTGSIDQQRYGEENRRTIEALSSYQRLAVRDLTMGESPAILHLFTARPTAETLARTFAQISLVNGSTGYTVTVAMPTSPGEGVQEEALALVEGVKVVGKEAEETKESKE